MALKGKENQAKDQQAAVTPEGSEVVAPKGKGKGAKGNSANQQVIKKGEELIAQMSEEQRNGLGAKSGTLHFKQLLGLASKKSLRRVDKDTSVQVSTPVAVRLVSTEDIQVPVIDILKDHKTGVDLKEDISYRTVPANEEFVLSYIEFMFLIIQPQYSGKFHANGEDDGAYFSPKLPQYTTNQSKLPTPTINFRTGSIKANIEDIDQEAPDGSGFVIKEQYKEKFGPLLQKRTVTRSGGQKSKIAAPTAVATALMSMLGYEPPAQ